LRCFASVKAGEPGGGRGVVRAAGRGAVLPVSVPVWPWLAGSARLPGGPVTGFTFLLAGVALLAGRLGAWPCAVRPGRPARVPGAVPSGVRFNARFALPGSPLVVLILVLILVLTLILILILTLTLGRSGKGVQGETGNRARLPGVRGVRGFPLRF